MVALEASSPPPLSPTQSAFLAAYVDARCDIRVTARKLQIPLEAANAQFADPALQSHLAILDESEKRSARQAAIETIHQAIAGLKCAMEYKGDPAMTARGLRSPRTGRPLARPHRRRQGRPRHTPPTLPRQRPGPTPRATQT